MNLDSIEFIRDNLHKKIKVGAYVINLDEYANVGAHWIALYVKNIENIYVYSSYLNLSGHTKFR